MRSLWEEYLRGGTYGLASITMGADAFSVEVFPWVNENRRTVLRFSQPRLTSISIDATEDEEATFPLDIIAFDASEEPNGRWQFILRAEGFEVVFSGSWPTAETEPA